MTIRHSDHAVARAIDVSRPTVTRWRTRVTRPHRTFWPVIFRIIEEEFGMVPEKIHSTVGAYYNPDVPFKYNGVKSSRLDDHIKYNKDFRPGRGLFVDGKCVNKGYLSDERIAEVEKYLAENPHVPEKDTAPYW